MLKRRQEHGLMRDHNDLHYTNLPEHKIKNRLKELVEVEDSEDTDIESLRKRLKDVESTRHLMIWHDNSTILNHGYHLVMVAAIYDFAIYFTKDELVAAGRENLDIHTIVEMSQIYIMGRCISSEAENIAYVDTRRDDLPDLRIKLTTENQNELQETIRFFEGGRSSWRETWWLC